MQGEDTAPSRAFDPKAWPKERLLALLAPVNATAEAHRGHLQAIIEALREHGTSWAAIAERLGVSRQTAWERFT
jgi:transcriptional regulator with PAS, ATPase and Fis domain